MEGEVVMTTSTTTTMHVTYDDKANDNATEASLDGGVQGSADFRTQSTIKLELGVERGGGECANDDDYNNETRREKNHTNQPQAAEGRVRQ